MNVTVIGLGKLGLSLAAWLAERGHEVTGVDSNQEVVNTLMRGECPIQETGLAETLIAVGSRFHAVGSLPSRPDATFIVVPTPSKQNGSFDVSYVLDAAKNIGTLLRDATGYRLVVVVSTVMPGQMEQVKATLEVHSDKKCGKDIGLCYNPEFVALGSVLRDLSHPDLVLIGESDKRAGRMLQHMLALNVPTYRTNFVNAELAKLSINTFLTAKITFACMMARLAEKLPGADVDVVSNIVGADSRIGRKYLTGANGFGGPCFPRDNEALAQLAHQLGVSPRLPRTIIEENKGQIWAINSKVAELMVKDPLANVLVLGMAYKPGTPVMDESQGLRFYKSFRSALVKWYDPMAEGSVPRELVQEAIRVAGVVILMQPDPAFLDFDYGDTPVIDCWRLLRKSQPKNWHPMGIGET